MDSPAKTASDSEIGEAAAFAAAVQEGLDAAEAGRTMPFKDVRRWLLSWGKPDELPPPQRD